MSDFFCHRPTFCRLLFGSVNVGATFWKIHLRSYLSKRLFPRLASYWNPLNLPYFSEPNQKARKNFIYFLSRQVNFRNFESFLVKLSPQAEILGIFESSLVKLARTGGNFSNFWELFGQNSPPQVDILGIFESVLVKLAHRRRKFSRDYWLLGIAREIRPQKIILCSK